MTGTAGQSSEAAAFDRDEPFTLPIERRYPLDLSVRLPEVRRLYHESNASIWDVEKELDLDQIEVAGIDPGSREAAALVWSWRAWLAFSDISASEATLVRCCLEHDREADFKFILAARGTERAVAADACHQLAQRFGRYVAAPSTPELSRLFASEAIRRPLDSRVEFDAYVVAHFVVLAAVERALLQAATRFTTEATCHSALDEMLVAAARQERAGRLYLNERAHRLTDAQRGAVAANIAVVVEIDLLSGFRCVALLDPELPGAPEVIEAESRTAAAGLGAAPPAHQRQVTATTLDNVRRELQALGIDADGLATVTE